MAEANQGKSNRELLEELGVELKQEKKLPERRRRNVLLRASKKSSDL